MDQSSAPLSPNTGGPPTNTALLDPPAPDPSAEAVRLAGERASAEEELRQLRDAQHAQKVISRTQAEAKQHREAAEKLANDLAAVQSRLKQIEEADMASKQQYKELADRREQELKDLQARMEKERAEERERLASERTQIEQTLIREAVARAAAKAGIIDEDDIELPSLQATYALAKIVNGRVIGADDVASEMKRIKPAKFKSDSAPTPPQQQLPPRNENGQFVRPDPNVQQPGSAAAVDAATLPREDFEAMKARLRQIR